MHCRNALPNRLSRCRGRYLRVNARHHRRIDEFGQQSRTRRLLSTMDFTRSTRALFADISARAETSGQQVAELLLGEGHSSKALPEDCARTKFRRRLPNGRPACAFRSDGRRTSAMRGWRLKRFELIDASAIALAGYDARRGSVEANETLMMKPLSCVTTSAPFKLESRRPAAKTAAVGGA